MGNRCRIAARLIVAVPAGAHGRGHGYGHEHADHRHGKPLTVI